jgi:hypothetical protein
MNDSIKLWRDVATADPVDAHALLSEALAIAEKMQREGRLTTNQTEWPNVFRTVLAKHP